MRKLIIGAVAALAALLSVPAAAGVATATPAATCASASTGDSLYVGDAVDNTVNRFDAATGCSQGSFGSPSEGLNGPRGILHVGNFLVSNQNVAPVNGQSINGEIDQYSHVNGNPLGALVPPTDANAPCDPDGIILGPDNRTLYVADLGDCQNDRGQNDLGRVATYNVTNGHFLGNLDFSSFISNTGINPVDFAPRGLVFGPDGLLYVSVVSTGRSGTSPTETAALGWILSYNTRTGAVRLVASNSGSGCSADLHRPDGLTFGPDGKLYVTSFRVNRTEPTDIDRILVFNTATGACTDEIDLDQLGQPRAYAQYILFGPGGYLFVPIAGDPGNAGAVLRYDVSTKTFTYFIAPVPGGQKGVAWGLTFGRTNPTTLAYESS